MLTVRKLVPQLGGFGTRSVFGWFDAAFNKHDAARVKEVGPDRAAAEWLLRCGAGVRWEQGSNMIKDYNALPVGNKGLKIAEIDGTDSVIMEDGFNYLDGLTSLNKVKLINNKYLTDSAVGYFCVHTKNRLREHSQASVTNRVPVGLDTLVIV